MSAASTPYFDDLAARASALTNRFADVGAKLAHAARELRETGAPLDDALVEELALAREEFIDLHGLVVAAAEQAGLRPAGALESIQSLESAIAAIAQALAPRTHHEAIEQARAAVLGILDRAATLVHRDDPGFAPLQSCYAMAAELRAAVELAADAAQAQVLTESVRAFAELLALVEQPRTFDAEVYAQLEEDVARVFGAPLAVAAAQGLLAVPADLDAEGAGVAPPETAYESAAATSLPSSEPEVEATVVAASPSPVAPVLEPPPVPFTVATPPEAPPAADDDSAQWWLAAWARWSGWRSSLSFADAVREELGKYPYLLSVPIQESPKYEDGLAAYGYSILLDHVERLAPGSIANALHTLAPSGTQSVGAQLYVHLVTQGRLAQTYADFLRDVLVAALPEPAMWFAARIVDGKENTRLFTRPTPRLGESQQSVTRLNTDAQRFTTHHFTATLPPLTTRFFLLSVEPTETRSADVHIMQGGSPSDSAWLAPVPSGPKARVAPVRVAPEGTTVGALGRDAKTLWIAIFNPDAAAAGDYSLALGFRKESRTGFGSKKRGAS